MTQPFQSSTLNPNMTLNPFNPQPSTLNPIMNRDTIIALRPKLNIDDNNVSEVEKFQNKALRPILKFQHDLIMKLASQKFPALPKIQQSSERSSYIMKILNGQPILNQLFVGVIVGLLSNEELNFYLENINELNKRIKHMIIERIASNSI
ncbi:MAG: hypothetical protein RLZZ546_2299 [Bacteroidota bacterium]|jgi:hypothetical protein